MTELLLSVLDQEVVLLTITYEHEARRRSYELNAEEFGLEPGVVAEARAVGS